MNKYRLVNTLDKNEWSKFVNDHPNGNVFQTFEFYQVYKRSSKHEPIFLAIFNKNNIICGLLLAVIQKEHDGFLGIFSSRSIIDGGPLIINNNPDILEIILKGYKELVKGKAIFTIFRNYWDWEEKKEVFKKHGFSYTLQLNILISLNQPLNEILKGISRNKRRNVTKSLNKGTTIHEVVSIADFRESLKLIFNTYKKIRIPIPDESFFLNAFEILGQRSMLKIFIAKSNEKTIGIRMEFIYKDLIFDWYAGSDYTERNKYPNDLLIFNILKWGNNNGYSVFDFGGAGNPNVEYGVREHKKKFGGELVEFGRFQCDHNIILMKVGTFLYAIQKIYKRYGF